MQGNRRLLGPWQALSLSLAGVDKLQHWTYFLISVSFISLLLPFHSLSSLPCFSPLYPSIPLSSQSDQQHLQRDFPQVTALGREEVANLASATNMEKMNPGGILASKIQLSSSSKSLGSLPSTSRCAGSITNVFVKCASRQRPHWVLTLLLNSAEHLHRLTPLGTLCRALANKHRWV